MIKRFIADLKTDDDRLILVGYSRIRIYMIHELGKVILLGRKGTGVG